MMLTKRHEMQQHTKLESLYFEHKLAQHIKSDSKSFYTYRCMYEVSKMFEIRLDHWRTMLEI